MSTTLLANVNDQIQKFWSPMFMKELRESLLLGAMVNKEFSGDLKNLGDTVKVSQIIAPNGELRTAGIDADSFDSEQLASTQVEVKADKRAVASFEFDDLVQLQSQIGAQDSEIRTSLMFAIEKQINNYLFSLVNPSTSSPDHLLNSVSTMDAAQLSAIRVLMAKAKWEKSKGWWGLLSPEYYQNVLDATTLVSKDYVGDETPVVGGQIVNKRYGINLMEDNSRNGKRALFFHPDFMYMVMQQAPRFKLSDLHSNHKFGYVLSIDLIFGAKIGISGPVKHIWATSAASGIDANGA